MSSTESKMLPLSTTTPDFHLTDVVTGSAVSLALFDGKRALLVMFICRHCPYVKHVQVELARIGRDYETRDAGIVAISSNDASAYPDDAPPGLRAMALELGFTFPLCYDETQDVARAFDAACTPDFFVFNEKRLSVYRGQLDDSRRRNAIPVSGRSVRDALDAVIAGQPVPQDQIPSLGCNIKWRGERGMQ